MRLSYLLIILIVLAFSIDNSFAQETQVHIKAASATREPLSSATITVLSVPDTTNKQQKLADSSGTAVFSLQLNHPYLVRISSVNYNSLEKSITVKTDNQVFTFVAEASNKALSNVTITATRPLIRQEDDKTIVDPENLALSSTNAYEIVEKTPGLFVDQDGNIYLNSTTPARVYINGREQKMSAADMATILKSLPPNAISSIEIMRSPSARYDASGSGGIVNVILRKGVRIGLTGSINVGLNQGTYGNQFAGFTLNNNNGKLTENISLQYSRRNSFENLNSSRYFSADSILSQDARTKYPANSLYVGYGLGYQFNDKWELNYDGRISNNSSKTSSTNLSEIKKLSTGETITRNEADVNNNGNNFNISQGLSLKNKLDDKGSEWTTDLSYSYSPNKTNQSFITSFLLPVYPSSTGEGKIDNRFSYFSAQTNYLRKAAHNITVETGLKSTNVWFNNSTDYYRIVNGSKVKDNGRTGAYNYNENINAAYLQASKSFNQFIIKAGTRLENTNMSGHQLIPKDTSFAIHRTDLFPYVYLSRGLMKIAGYELRAFLVYRRTINRPAYEYLNPSQRYIDPYLFETGNPSLRPQFTNNYEANISVDDRPIFAVGVNDAKDIFTQVVYQADTSRKQAFRTYDNLGSNKETYFRAMGAIPPGRKYFFVIGTQYNHNFYNGLYEGNPLEFRKGSWTFFTYHSLKLRPNTQLSLHGFARFNGQLQFYELSNFGQLNFSINQQFLQKKLTVSLSASDIFYTNKNEFTIHQGSMNAFGLREQDSRRFGLNLRYNFGIRKKEENKLPDMESLDRGRP
jgi:hypothetical protein